MHRGFRYRLHPTPSQAQSLREWVGTVRLVYNLALEQRRDFWRQYRANTGRSLTWASQSKEVTDLRVAFDWIAAVPRSALEQALRDLDKAFAGFFARRSGFPSPRRRGQHDAFRLQAAGTAVRRLNAKWSQVWLPKLGWVKFRDTGRLPGQRQNITVAQEAGTWAIVFGCEVEREVAPTTLPAVGIDRGVSRTLSLSTGEHFQAPSVLMLTKRRRRLQKALARCKRGSARRKSARDRVARVYARERRIRADWCHRTSTALANRFGVVAMENLNVRGMTASASGTRENPGRSVTQKRGLNRSILEQGWSLVATLLEYKLAERGGRLILVPAAYTSQTCASCGVVDARSRESQAAFHCVACDHTDNADVNAAKEILRRSTAWLDAEGSHFEPRETSIMAAA